MKIIKVTKEYFETEDGVVYQHIEPLDEVPSLKEFQEIYDKWEKIFNTQKNEDSECQKN
jgi:hypothetical protein